ncbi:MAG TPA: hypothetical protein VF962_07805, partial [Gemmatimonadaceae bacterium]
MPIAAAEPMDRHLTFSRWLAETLLRWRLIAKMMGLAIVLAVLALIFIPPNYLSRASFVANTSSGNKLPSIAGASGLGGIASQLGMASSGDPSETPGFYMKLIESRELLTRLLLSRFHDPRSDSPRDSATLLDILRIRNSDPKRRLEIGIKRIGSSIDGNYDIKTNLVA